MGVEATHQAKQIDAGGERSTDGHRERNCMFSVVSETTTSWRGNARFGSEKSVFCGFGTAEVRCVGGVKDGCVSFKTAIIQHQGVVRPV